MNIAINTIYNNIGLKHNIKYINNNNKFNKNLMIELLYDNDFIPREYIYNIINNKSDKIFINFEYNKLKIDLLIYFYKKNGKEISIDKKYKKIEKIIYWIISLYELSNKNKKYISIYIYLTEYKKKIKNNCILGVKDINNAGCYITNGENGGPIIIWRNEDLYKVLTHELIHVLEFDRKLNYNKYDIDMSKLYSINNHYNIGEVYTETLALFINIIIETKYNEMDYKNIIYLIKKQKNHCYNNINKLLKLYNKCNNNTNNNKFTYFIKNINENTKNKVKEIYKQNTSVFSYYFLTCACFINIENYINFFIKNKNDNKLKLDLYINNKDIDKYINMVYKYYKILIKKIERDKQYKKKLDNSLKMSYI